MQGLGRYFLPTNNGTSWTAVDSAVLTIPYVSCLAVRRDKSLCIDWRRLSFNEQRDKLDGGRFRLDDSLCFLSRCERDKSLCRDWRRLSFQLEQRESWTAINSGLTNSDVFSLAVSGANLFAGTYVGVGDVGAGGGVFLSTNNGTSWTAVDSGWNNSAVLSLLVSGTNLFAGTDGSGVIGGDRSRR